jgi:hypothetical protein
MSKGHHKRSRIKRSQDLRAAKGIKSHKTGE